MRVGHGPTNLRGRFGRQLGCTFFMGFVVLSMGLGDCEEGNTGFVTITSPEAGTVFTSAETVTIEATVLEELLGDVSKVEFYDGATETSPVCTDTDGPQYQCAWPITGADNGTHRWTARAYFSNGSTIDSKTVELTVNITPGTRGNGPPGSFGTGLIGMVPGVGTAADIVVQNGMAYIASNEFGLSIVDVTDPSQPEMLGASSVPFRGTAVAVEGVVAVVVNGGQMEVVDVSEPLRPTPVGAVPGISVSVARAGHFAYGLRSVGGNPPHIELVVVDLSVPHSPVVVGAERLAGGADLQVIGSFAYVAAAGAGLQIVDISDAANPTIIKTVDTPGGAVGVTVDNGYAYVADHSSVQIIDVHNPATASVVGSIDEHARSVAVAGSTLYATSGSYLRTINISNPADPRLQGTLYDNDASMAGLDVRGSHALIASPDHGLYVVDVSAPTQPWTVTNLHGLQSSSYLAAQDSLAVAAGPDRLYVVDVSDPTAPTPIAHIPGSFGTVARAGEFVYALLGVPGNPGHMELTVLDLSVPESPQQIGSEVLSGGRGIELVGSLAYVAAGGGKLDIVDISNPANPTLITTVNTPGAAREVTVGGGYAYVADSSSVQIIDVHDPENARVVGTLDTYAQHVAIAGNNLYFTSGAYFNIADVSNPAAPRLRSTLGAIDAVDVEVIGDRAYLAKPKVTSSSNRGAVLIVDISDGDNPEVIGQIELPGKASSLTLDGDLLYVADDAAMIDVIAVGQ